MLQRILGDVDHGAGVSIAGAILWGVLQDHFKQATAVSPVSIAGAILWGVLLHDAVAPLVDVHVSIAGAILWGVLPQGRSSSCHRPGCFNRRGDSLGGAAQRTLRVALADLFQSQGRFFGGCCRTVGKFRYVQI